MSLPRVADKHRGYDVAAVDHFFARISESATGIPSVGLVRSAMFPLAKGGYVVRSVDDRLDSAEDEALDAERVARIREIGFEAANSENREFAQEILNRVSRAAHHKFRRVSMFTYGYDRAAVDRFAARVSDYFTHAVPLTRSEVRSMTFAPQLGGYDEKQVDYLLDELVRVMFAAR